MVAPGCPSLHYFLEYGARKHDGGSDPFPTLVRSKPRPYPLPGYERYQGLTDKELWRWYTAAYAIPPYHFKDRNMVAYTMLRTPTAEEQERMHGFPSRYTVLPLESDDSEALLSEDARKSRLGNSFSCVAVAMMLGSWAVNEGMLRKEHTV